MGNVFKSKEEDSTCSCIRFLIKKSDVVPEAFYNPPLQMEMLIDDKIRLHVVRDDFIPPRSEQLHISKSYYNKILMNSFIQVWNGYGQGVVGTRIVFI